MKQHIEIKSKSIVVLGKFNPTIIQPWWLANKGLIRDSEAEGAAIKIIHHELVRFELSWCKIEVSQERYEVQTAEEPYFDVIMDLTLGIFRVLAETPINTIGLNHVFHFALNNDEDYYRLGNKLAPLDNWSNFMKNPRLLVVEMLEKERQDGENGYFRIKIQPAEPTITLSTKFGVTLNLNDHIVLAEGNNIGSGSMVSRINELWRSSLKRSEVIFEEINWIN